MSARAAILTKDTGISIGLVIVLIGGIGWLTSIKAEQNQHSKSIEKVERENIEIKSTLVDLKTMFAAEQEKTKSIKETVEKFDRKLERIRR